MRMPSLSQGTTAVAPGDAREASRRMGLPALARRGAGLALMAAGIALADGGPAPRILDGHVHAAGLGAKGSGCFVSPALRKSYKFPIYLKAFGVTEKELLGEGDGIVIDRIAAGLAASGTVGGAVVLALDGVADARGGLDTARTQIYLPNAFVAAEVRKHANLRFGASINPRRAYARDELARAKADGAVLVKWIPSIMDIDPADTALIPFYRALKEAGLPLLTHTGAEHSFLEAKDSLCDPARLELPLRLGVTVIAAHAGTTGQSRGQDNMERALAMMARFPNLYADISSLTQVNKLGYLKRALGRPEARGRLIYGSDYPLIATVLVWPYYQAGRAPFRRLRAAARESNPWDRDVALKRAMGVPEDVFRRTAELLEPGPAR
jgi:uncharacterized protein